MNYGKSNRIQVDMEISVAFVAVLCRFSPTLYSCLMRFKNKKPLIKI